MIRHPEFLLWRAKSNPQNVWMSGVDGIDNRLILRRRQLAIRRAIGAGHLQPGVGSNERFLKLVCCSCSAAIVEMATAIAGRDLRDFTHEIWAIDTLHALPAEEPRHPHQRHTVRCDHARLVMNSAQMRIAPAFHHAMGTADADVLAGVFADPALDCSNCVVEIDGADIDAEDIDTIATITGY